MRAAPQTLFRKGASGVCAGVPRGQGASPCVEAPPLAQLHSERSTLARSAKCESFKRKGGRWDKKTPQKTRRSGLRWCVDVDGSSVPLLAGWWLSRTRLCRFRAFFMP